MDDEDLRDHIVNTMDPDELVNTLEIDIERLVDLLWSEISYSREKLYYIEGVLMEEYNNE